MARIKFLRLFLYFLLEEKRKIPADCLNGFFIKYKNQIREDFLFFGFHFSYQNLHKNSNLIRFLKLQCLTLKFFPVFFELAFQFCSKFPFITVKFNELFYIFCPLLIS